jgi:hypothetical protein
MQRRLAALALLLTLTGACSHGDSFAAEFTNACTEAVNWDRDRCECMAERAEDELSPTGRSFLLATLRGDAAQTEKLRGDLSVSEAIKVGTFMLGGGTCG